jgi:hypothetical protein
VRDGVKAAADSAMESHRRTIGRATSPNPRALGYVSLMSGFGGRWTTSKRRRGVANREAGARMGLAGVGLAGAGACVSCGARGHASGEVTRGAAEGESNGGEGHRHGRGGGALAAARGQRSSVCMGPPGPPSCNPRKPTVSALGSIETALT